MKDFLIMLLVIIVPLGLVVGGVYLEEYYDKLDWNDGICNNCGEGHWHFVSAVGHRAYTGYIYQCDACGRTYEFNKMWTIERGDNYED